MPSCNQPQINILVYPYPNNLAYYDIIALVQLSLPQRHWTRFAGLFVDGAEAQLPIRHGKAKVDFESEEGCPLETRSKL